MNFKLEDNISDLNLCLIRKNESNHVELRNKIRNLIKDIFILQDKDESLYYFQIFYKLIGYVRDIKFGKGENFLSYFLIDELYNNIEFYPNKKEFFINICKNMINSWVYDLGSWKDLKYFCNFHIQSQSMNYQVNNLNLPLIDYCLNLYSYQIKIDLYNYYNNNFNNISLCAKWVPREKSKMFGRLANKLATFYYKKYEKMNYSTLSSKKDKNIQSNFRKIISQLNTAICTTEIYQCNRNWSQINFDRNVPSKTLIKQEKAFQNINKSGKKRIQCELDKNDRNLCADNYKLYLKSINPINPKNPINPINPKNPINPINPINLINPKNLINPINPINPKNLINPINPINPNFPKKIVLLEFAKRAVSNLTDLEKTILNNQWTNFQNLQNINIFNESQLSNLIPIIDISESMHNYNKIPLYLALALGIKISENSKFKNMVISFNKNPRWIKLNFCIGFTDKIKTILNNKKSHFTNIKSTLQLFLIYITSNNINPNEVKNMSILILSDMPFEFNYNNPEVFEFIKKQYEEVGLKSKFKKPFTVPHIYFWNLKPNKKEPIFYKKKNISLIEGFNLELINKFLKFGTNTFTNYMPWNNLENKLNNKKFYYLGKYLKDEWDKLIL